MKVKLVKIDPQFAEAINAVTVGKVYNVEMMTEWKSAHIFDDDGAYSVLLYGEYLVLPEGVEE